MSAEPRTGRHQLDQVPGGPSVTAPGDMAVPSARLLAHTVTVRVDGASAIESVKPRCRAAAGACAQNSAAPWRRGPRPFGAHGWRALLELRGVKLTADQGGSCRRLDSAGVWAVYAGFPGAVEVRGLGVLMAAIPVRVAGTAGIALRMAARDHPAAAARVKGDAVGRARRWLG